jgi:16S rRNA (cytidine1402-2'-O)-methyltransferase
VSATEPPDTPDGEPGRLVLVGTPVGNLGDVTARAVETLRGADVIACEDTRRTRALLSAIGVPAGGRLRAVHEHNEAESAAWIAEEVASGLEVAYVTDAGTPGISDPGGRLVRACVDAAVPVTAVPGPTALALALVLSGLPLDRFVFEGFLPRRGAERRARLAALAREPRTMVLFEAPARVAASLGDLAAACGADRPAAVLRELTKLHEEVLRAPLGVCAALALAGEPRGEHVVVVAGAPGREVSDETLTRAVRDALAHGASARDAASRVAADLDVPRRRVYELALSLRGR